MQFKPYLQQRTHCRKCGEPIEAGSYCPKCMSELNMWLAESDRKYRSHLAAVGGGNSGYLNIMSSFGVGIGGGGVT